MADDCQVLPRAIYLMVEDIRGPGPARGSSLIHSQPQR